MAITLNLQAQGVHAIRQAKKHWFDCGCRREARCSSAGGHDSARASLKGTLTLSVTALLYSRLPSQLWGSDSDGEGGFKLVPSGSAGFKMIAAAPWCSYVEKGHRGTASAGRGKGKGRGLALNGLKKKKKKSQVQRKQTAGETPGVMCHPAHVMSQMTLGRASDGAPFLLVQVDSDERAKSYGTGT
eukprot:3586238-Rhodomonas_salina.2